jgi:GT2 family glycosyltransferase
VLLDDSVARLLVKVREDRMIGVAHCRLVFDDGRTQHSAYRFPALSVGLIEDLGLYKLMGRRRAGETLLSGYWDYGRERDVDWVAGAFMLVPREVFARTGGFDERLFMYGEDLDWCYRIRDAGWRIRYFPQATIKHFDHVSSERRWGDERIAICLRRQRDIYRERSGRLRSNVLSGLRIFGTTLRLTYYSARVALGPRADAYRSPRRVSAYTLRTLLSLSVSRR